ncbi:MAG: NAD-dependent protein deacylase [Thermodesulfobacteriota bacterium]
MYKLAAEAIKGANRVCVFTGAGISVESGIPPFRGKDGLWNKYDPTFLTITYFYQRPRDSWILIKEIFYDFFGQAKPNAAHYAIAALEQKGLIQATITQNIDNLHYEAGGRNIFEFHGTSQYLLCKKCGKRYHIDTINLSTLPPLCKNCGQVLKPDFVFFGEPIPEQTNTLSFHEAEVADVFLLIGTTGEIMPASMIPHVAKRKGATIIEVNPEESNYTRSITDIFLREKATIALPLLAQELGLHDFFDRQEGGDF